MKPMKKTETHGSILGTRIRQRRREVGLTQADLAKKIGISASYLNLIEWNKRPISGALLQKVAKALKLRFNEINNIAEMRLLETLSEIAHLPSLKSLAIEHEHISEFIGRFPGWAKAMASVVRSEHEAVSRIQVLSDRLSNNPFLNETLHRMLTRIAAIRSAVEILTDHKGLPKKKRDRFINIIHEESRILSDIGEALVGYLDNDDETDRILTPIDEVEALFELNHNRFVEIEAVTARLTGKLTDSRPISRRTKAEALVDKHLKDLIAEITNNPSHVKTAAGRRRAERALYIYAVNAILMPMDTFVERSSEVRYDIEALTDAFSVGFNAVCHRLTALPDHENTPQFGFIQANAAGTIIEMFGLEGLAVPRYASACPLWVLFRAQQSPETVIRQRALFPSGARFILVARARNTGATGFGKPRHYVTDMLAIKEADAKHTIYAPEASVPVEEVGPSCRLCPRHACLHRVEDPLAE